MRFFWAIALLLAASLPLSAQSVPYLPTANAPKLDIYGLPDDAVAPVMVYIHGGGWTSGSRRKVFDMPAFFNARGFVFVSVGYTLVPAATVEQQLEEIDAALAYVALNISDYGGDAANLFLMGHSAGAHLATMSVLRPLSTMQDWLLRGSLKGVISNDVRGYDLLVLQSHFPNGRFTGAYAKVFGHERGRLVSLSPQLYLGGDAMEGAVPLGVPLPPFLVTYSGGEMRAPLSLSFAEALRGDGAAVSLFFGEGYTHGEMNKRFGTEGPLTDAVEAFLARAIAVETF